MATITDPATELTNLASQLSVVTSQKGGDFLANKFQVEAWSSDFQKIISCILARADAISRIVEESDLDEINKTVFDNDITAFKWAFSGPLLTKPWSNGEGSGLATMKEQGTRIGLIQGTVRPLLNYPRLNDQEIAELVELIDAYLKELASSDVGPRFVRQAIRDGLLEFRFQLVNLNWVGSGYLLKEFRSLVEIYRQANDYLGSMDGFDPKAVLTGMWTVIQRFKSVVETVKPYTDAASYLWAGYSIVAPFVPGLPPPPLLLEGPT